MRHVCRRLIGGLPERRRDRRSRLAPCAPPWRNGDVGGSVMVSDGEFATLWMGRHHLKWPWTQIIVSGRYPPRGETRVISKVAWAIIVGPPVHPLTKVLRGERKPSILYENEATCAKMGKWRSGRELPGSCAGNGPSRPPFTVVKPSRRRNRWFNSNSIVPIDTIQNFTVSNALTSAKRDFSPFMHAPGTPCRTAVG